nr:12931_t:CDS:2 [Entrophospora candida]
MHQMASGVHARESANAMRDLLNVATHVVAMDAFANDSTLAFLKSYRGENVRVIDNKYQPRKGEIVKFLYDPDKGSEGIRRGFRMLQEGKHVAFVMTSCKKARALADQMSKLQKPDGSFILSRVYFGQMDGKQRQDDFANIDATWSALDCVIYTSTVEAGISFEISGYFDTVIGITNIATPVHVEAFAQMLFRISLRPGDLPTIIKGQRAWDKITDCYALNLSPAVETYIEVEYQRRLSAKYFPEILCSLIASTGATLELILVEDTEKVNRNKISHTIKNTEKKIKGADAESIANAPDISPNEAEILKQNPIRSFADNMTLQCHYLWRIYASDFVERYNNPEPLQHFRRLAYFRRQGYNAINSIENLKIKEEMQWEDSHESIDPSSVDLHKFYSVKQWEAVHNLVQSIGFSDIDDTNILSGDDVAKTFEQSREKIIKIREDALLLFGFKTRAKGTPDLNATIKFINAILDNGAGFETIERIIAIKSNDPNYYPTNPILPPYKPESVNETQELFDSIPMCLDTSSTITTDITISKSSNKVCEKSSCNNIVEKSMTNLPQLSSIVLAQNQSNNFEQFSNITETRIEIPESLTSLSSEFLIKNESDIDTLIFYLQEKFQMSKEKLEQWRAKITFEMRDNHNYWKKEHESMNEAEFLEYKRNFEAKMKVPTTPHKRELKTYSLALIEYA